MSVAYADPEPSGLAAMVGGLIDQNLKRDPARRRLLRTAVVAIAVPDAGVSITLRLGPDGIELQDGADPTAHLSIVADSDRLLALTSAPLLFGWPDPFDRRGRAVLRAVISGRVRIRGLVRHPRRLARFSSLLSVT